MLRLLIIVLVIVVALLRGGSLRNFAALHLRWLPLVSWVAANWRIPGMALIASWLLRYQSGCELSEECMTKCIFSY